MGVAIRLSRIGRKNRAFYRIVIADRRFPRDGRHCEIVGSYDPIPTADRRKMIGLNFKRVKYWLSVGAQPTPTVARLLGMAGILPPLPRRGPEAAAAKRAAKSAADSQ